MSNPNPENLVDLFAGFLDQTTGLNTRDQINRVMRRRPNSQVWTPLVDVISTGDNIVITVELPGVEEKSINIDVFNNKLTISGEKKPYFSPQAQVHESRKEIIHGPFARTIILPLSVTRRESVHTDLVNGLLVVTIDKNVEAEHKFSINFTNRAAQSEN